MKKVSIVSLSIAAGTLFTACLFQSPDTAGTGVAKAQAKFQIKAAPQVAKLAKAAAGTLPFTMSDLSGFRFTIQDARINVKKIKLESAEEESGSKACGLLKSSSEGGGNDSGKTGEQECPEDNELTLKGPYVVDLLTGASYPSLDTLSVPVRIYEKIKMKFDYAKKGSAVLDSTDPLIGNTLLVRGTYGVPGMPEQPFSLSLKFDEEMEIASAAGMQLNATSLSNIVISLKMDQWLTNLNIKGCLDQTDVMQSLTGGATVFSEESPLGKCLDIGKTIKENITKSFDVGEEDEKDGENNGGKHDSSGSSGKIDSTEHK